MTSIRVKTCLRRCSPVPNLANARPLSFTVSRQLLDGSCRVSGTTAFPRSRGMSAWGATAQTRQNREGVEGQERERIGVTS